MAHGKPIVEMQSSDSRWCVQATRKLSPFSSDCMIADSLVDPRYWEVTGDPSFAPFGVTAKWSSKILQMEEKATNRPYTQSMSAFGCHRLRLASTQSNVRLLTIEVNDEQARSEQRNPFCRRERANP